MTVACIMVTSEVASEVTSEISSVLSRSLLGSFSFWTRLKNNRRGRNLSHGSESTSKWKNLSHFRAQVFLLGFPYLT